MKIVSLEAFPASIAYCHVERSSRVNRSGVTDALAMIESAPYRVARAACHQAYSWADGPDWGLIDRPGPAVEIDEDKLARYVEAYREGGQFLPN